MANDAWAGWQREVAGAVVRSKPLFAERAAEPPEELREALTAALGVPGLRADPDVRVEDTFRRDGLEGADLSWTCGYGPRTRAWLLRPDGAGEPLPGVLALFEHGGVKMLGREKLSDGAGLEGPVALAASAHREACSGGRAWAEELARRGVAVLVHDAFGFGSRRLPAAEASARTVRAALAQGSLAREEAAEASGDPAASSPAVDPEALHAGFEGEAAKAAGVLGTSWAGLLAAEDLFALDVLGSLPWVDGARLAAAGMSGGGARAGVLRVLAPQLRATAIVAMMSTLPELMAGHADAHSWTWLSPGLGTVGDWPSVVASWTSNPLLVQYGLADHLFPRSGMERAHEQIRRRFEHFGDASNYTGAFYPSGHVFTAAMQNEAFGWLASRLGP
ncbi:acetylesterase [Sinomonas sp. P10A9]|uniref:Acetylesterase n=1 Tax=Sinomonas puerhi TaxID=3238584 RepID=A0AB39L112_9MICC